MKHRKSDILWKVILEEVFGDLLRFIYPDADEVYDMERGFEFLDKELAELNPQPDEDRKRALEWTRSGRFLTFCVTTCYLRNPKQIVNLITCSDKQIKPVL